MIRRRKEVFVAFNTKAFIECNFSAETNSGTRTSSHAAASASASPFVERRVDQKHPFPLDYPCHSSPNALSQLFLSARNLHTLHILFPVVGFPSGVLFLLRLLRQQEVFGAIIFLAIRGEQTPLTHSLDHSIYQGVI